MAGYLAARDSFLAGANTPRGWLEACAERIAAREPTVQAFVTLNLAGARAAADAATARYRAGRPLSPVDGMPIAVKDLIETADMPTQFGSAAFQGWSGGRDAAPIFALRAAGAVILGKTVTTEFGIGGPGPTRNPHDPRRTPGGSSSGSAAAVAAGFAPVALGTQVGGSVLRPASFCGIIGFKPTYGALNRGQLSDQFSQNCLGVLAVALDDAWAVCHEIATRVGGDPGHIPFAGGALPAPPRRPERLAIVRTAGWEVATDAAKAAFAACLDGFARDGVVLLDSANSARVALLERAIAEAAEISTGIASWESLFPIAELALRAPGKLHPRTMEHVTAGQLMTPDDYVALLHRRDALRDALVALSDDIDGCVTLGAPGAAPIGIETTGNAVFNVPASSLRCPAISLPLLSDEGMPLGLQLIGYPNRERGLSGIAAWMLGGGKG